MMLILNTWAIIFYFLLLAMFFKTITGFHFPWEKCDCCGKKFREHKKVTDNYGILPPKVWAEPNSPPEERYRGFTVDEHKIDSYLHLLACTFLTKEQIKAIEKIREAYPIKTSTKKKNRMEGCV